MGTDLPPIAEIQPEPPKPKAVYFNQDGLRYELYDGGCGLRRQIRIAKLKPIPEPAPETIQ